MTLMYSVGVPAMGMGVCFILLLLLAAAAAAAGQGCLFVMVGIVRHVVVSLAVLAARGFSIMYLLCTLRACVYSLHLQCLYFLARSLYIYDTTSLSLRYM